MIYNIHIYIYIYIYTLCVTVLNTIAEHLYNVFVVYSSTVCLYTKSLYLFPKKAK